MLKSLLLFTLMLNLAFAKDRFTDADKKKFLEDVKQGIAEHKVENNGRVDLQIIKPGLYAELEDSLKQEKITRDEMNKIKQNYESFSKDRSITVDKAETAFYAFMEKELNEISKKPLVKISEGNICNNWGCEEGLKCAPDPLQFTANFQMKGKRAGAACTVASECASQECTFDGTASKKKVCEEVYKCYRPLKINESCMSNPVCGSGRCLPFMSMTSGIGECDATGSACKKSSDCCSNSCQSGKCVDNFICKDCVSNGSKPTRGQKCCEGLYINEKGLCVPDVPPSVINEVRVIPIQSILISFVNILISSADAEESTNNQEAEASFLNLGVKNDGLDLRSGVYANESKLGKLNVSKESETLNMNKDKAKLIFSNKSNFATCDMRFKDDFYNSLKTDGTFDLEVAMLGFEFVITGDSDSDYWRNGTIPAFPASPKVNIPGVSQIHEQFMEKLKAEANKNAGASNSIFNRLKAIGLAHRQVRAETNLQIDIINRKLTCACLDVQGYKKIASEEKRKFFETCDEFAKYQNPEISLDELTGDASGLKAKRLLVIWTQSLRQFHSQLAIQNGTVARDLATVTNFVKYDAKWNEAEQKNYNLFQFSIKNPSGSVAGLGAIVGALLAAGVIAIMGGFATTSILSVWATAGIIGASAATGAGGLWMIATLKGAWITMKPEISDGVVMPRSYSCGKKESCTDFTRTLIQPYNNICNTHTSANACIKSFIIVSEGNEARYVVDPWIPVGVSKAAVTNNQPNYVEKLEEGFNAAKNAMILKNPGATGGGDKKGGGNFVSESYLSEVFVDAHVLGKYAPAIGSNMKERYFFSQDKVKIIKEAAKKFAVSEGFIEADDIGNLNEFADYAYEYHFIWPKKSRPEEVSYPTVGLSTYLQYMTNDVSSNLSGGLSATVGKLAKLEVQYRNDLQATLDLYDKTLNQVDGLKKAVLQTEIDKNKSEIASLVSFNSLFDSKNLDSQLQALGANTKGSNLSGGSGGLSNDQLGVLKAVAGLRATRKAQLKSLDVYNKAIAESGNKDRAARVASASKKFTNQFAKGNASFSDAKIGSNSSPLNSNATDANANKKGSGAFGNVNLGNTGLSGSGGLYGSGSGSSSGSSKLTETANNTDSTGGVSEADANKLADAIDARDKANKDKYQSNDGQSLFEKVTNAYIRNYDKVLTKKKDKDVVEDKQ